MISIKQFEKFINHVNPLYIAPYESENETERENSFTAVMTKDSIFILSVDNIQPYHYLNTDITHYRDTIKKYMDRKNTKPVYFPTAKTLTEGIRREAGRKYSQRVLFRLSDNNLFDARKLKDLHILKPETAFINQEDSTSPIYINGINGIGLLLPVNWQIPKAYFHYGFLAT